MKRGIRFYGYLLRRKKGTGRPRPASSLKPRRGEAPLASSAGAKSPLRWKGLRLSRPLLIPGPAAGE